MFYLRGIKIKTLFFWQPVKGNENKKKIVTNMSEKLIKTNKYHICSKWSVVSLCAQDAV